MNQKQKQAKMRSVLEALKPHNPALIEAITKGFTAIMESDDEYGYGYRSSDFDNDEIDPNTDAYMQEAGDAIEFVNLTPHRIVLVDENGEEITVEPSGSVARVSTSEEEAGKMKGVKCVTRSTGKAEGIPAPKLGRYGNPEKVYIVSSMVLAAVSPSRVDVCAPDTGPTAIRHNGQVVAVTRLVLPS